MEIETLKKSHLKRNILIVVVVLAIISVMILQFTRARYRVTESIPLVNGVINYTAPDLNVVAIYVDGVATDTLPDGNYELTSESYCEIDGERTEVTLSYESSTQALSVTPFTTRGTKCYLYFEEANSAVDIIEGLYEDNQNILAYDGTTDNNLRYIGADPDNYVYFNCSDYSNPSSSTCELWRIIGIMNNMESADGSSESLVKLIRNESLGLMAWDDGGSSNWSGSLGNILNSDYLNRTGDYSSTGITSATRNMIETVIWKLGGPSSVGATASTFYTAERGTNVYSRHPTEWEGKIALIYPSDYGYATSGGSTGRDTCLRYDLTDWRSYSECFNNDWLYTGSTYWVLTPSAVYDYTVYTVYNSGPISSTSRTDRSNYTYPSLYLTSNVTITGGSGTESNPYTLEIS